MPVSVQSNGLIVTGSGESFAGVSGDLFILNGISVAIQSVDSASQITLKAPWPGATLSNQTAFHIVPLADSRLDTPPILARLNALLATTSAQLAQTLPVGGVTGNVLAKKTGANYDVEWVELGEDSTPDPDPDPDPEETPGAGSLTDETDVALTDELGAQLEF